jgi:hypothetical protein
MSIIVFQEDIRLLPWEHDEYFMNLLNMSKYDVRQMLRKSRGILQVTLTTEQANQVCEYFKSKNIECVIEEENNIPVIPKAKKSNYFVVEDGKLSFYPFKGFGKVGELLFEEIGIFSLGFFPGPKFAASKMDMFINILPDSTKVEDEELKKELKEKIGALALRREKGIDTSLARKGYITKSDLSTLKKEDIKIYFEVFSCDLQSRMRLVSTDLNYEILGEEAGLNSVTNFLKVVDLLINLVQNVNLTPKLTEFLQTQDYFNCIFESEDEFDTYNIWYIYKLIKNSQSEERQSNIEDSPSDEKNPAQD